MTNLQLAVADPGESHDPDKSEPGAMIRNRMESFERSHNRKRNLFEHLRVGIRGMHATLLRGEVNQDSTLPPVIAAEEAAISYLVAERNGIGKDVERRELV